MVWQDGDLLVKFTRTICWSAEDKSLTEVGQGKMGKEEKETKYGQFFGGDLL